MKHGIEVEIRVNGEERRVPAGKTLVELLLYLGQEPRAVAVEHNGDVVRRVALETTTVVAGDRIEIVRFVQGG